MLPPGLPWSRSRRRPVRVRLDEERALVQLPEGGLAHPGPSTPYRDRPWRRHRTPNSATPGRGHRLRDSSPARTLVRPSLPGMAPPCRATASRPWIARRSIGPCRWLCCGRSNCPCLASAGAAKTNRRANTHQARPASHSCSSLPDLSTTIRIRSATTSPRPRRPPASAPANTAIIGDNSVNKPKDRAIRKPKAPPSPPPTICRVLRLPAAGDSPTPMPISKPAMIPASKE